MVFLTLFGVLKISICHLIRLFETQLFLNEKVVKISKIPFLLDIN